MERGSSKHARWMDDLLAQELRDLHGTSVGGRADEWREPELLAADQSDSVVPSTDDHEARSRLGRYVPRSVFPANRDEIVAAARDSLAPDDVLAELSALDAGGTYQNVAQIWAGLGHGPDQRF
jgi:hypothetical protein